jgi:subtilisin family serine protease
MRRSAFRVSVVAAGLCTVSGATAGVIDPALEDLLAKSDPKVPVSVLVYLQDRVDLESVTRDMDAKRARLVERHEVVVRALQDKAEATQGDLKAHLQARKTAGAVSDFRDFWIVNAFRAEVLPSEVAALAARPDVDRVYINYPIESIKPVGPDVPDQAVPVGGIEPGVMAVRAPEVWGLGITGEGVLVASLDTGVDGNHPALASRWRGLDPAYAGHPQWAWFDPVTSTTFPQAFGAHGTHTMGTVCGGTPGDQVGVAPDAEWIHAAVIDRVSIAQTIADAILSFQWMIDPDGNPATNFDVPAVCSNSWGLADVHGVPDCDQTFWAFLDASEAAGTVQAFSAGNEGSAANSLRRPADRATDAYRTFAVGAVDGNVPSWPIAGFSSRGPTNCGPGGSLAIKPDISAPGVNVRSAMPGGGYGNMSGTSMASPHINGVVALIRQANPDISVNDIKQVIYDTAFNLGPAGEDNDYGWGMVDAFEAVQAVQSLSFSFPDGRPDVLDHNGGTIVHVVINDPGDPVVPGTATFHYSDGGPFTSVPMTLIGPGDYNAAFGAFDCGAVVQYYFSVQAQSGSTYQSPVTAPVSSYTATADFSGSNIFFEDDFEANQGWTVVNGPGLTTGGWQRVIPISNAICARGNPGTDVDTDGAGFCFVTQNSSSTADCDLDVDNGSTTVTSPNMDASDPQALLGYSRWYDNTGAGQGASPFQDIFVVEVSDDGGANWVNLETVGPNGQVTGGWFAKEFLVSAIPGITNTSTLRVRFTASDTNPQSIVEAGIDAVKIFYPFCDSAPCPADLNGDGSVAIEDFLELLSSWGPNPGHPADLDGDGSVGITDFLTLLATWGPCD